MADSRKIKVEVIGDATSLEKMFGKMSRGSSSAGSSLAKLTAGVVGVGAAVSVIKTSVEAASNLNEQMNKVNVVFKEGGKEVTNWSKTTATGLGIAQDQALEFAGTFGNLLIPMGLARTKAATMSTQLVKLAADLASFNNANPEEVLTAMQSALSGQIEPMRRFGVFLSQDRIKAFALTHGIVKVTKDMSKVGIAQRSVEIAQRKLTEARKKHAAGSTQVLQAENAFAQANVRLGKALKGNTPELTQAQKAMATYGIVLQDTKDAQGDFGRTSGGLANQQRIFSAQIRNLEATLGKAFLPSLLKVVKAVNEWLSKSENQHKIMAAVKQITAAVTGATKLLFDIVQKIAPIVQNLVGKLGGWKTVLAGIVALKFASKVGGMAGSIVTFTNNTKGALSVSKKLLATLLRFPATIPIAIALSIILNKDAIDKKVTGWLNSHGLGAFTGGEITTYDEWQKAPSWAKTKLRAAGVDPHKLPGAPGTAGSRRMGFMAGTAGMSSVGFAKGAGAGASNVGGIVVHNLTVVSNDPDDMQKKLQKKAGRYAGSRSGPYGGYRLGTN